MPNLTSVTLAAAMLAFAIGNAHAAPSSPSSDPPPEMPGVAIPAGQVERAVATLDSLVVDILHRSGIPGLAIAVVRNGATVYAKGFGVRGIGAPEKVDADTVFQLASVSKPVGATVIAAEIGRHVVAWDTPVVQHLPWFALQDEWITQHVTIADMYAHRSGLGDHAGDDLEDLGYDRRQVLERLRVLPLHSFRVDYAYTNFGITAAAESVAAAAGTDWASLSEEAIYKPLGMASTSSRFADFIKREDRATPHIKVGGAFVPKYQREPDAESPAGGVSSSVHDMTHWMAMVLQGGLYEGRTIVPKEALLPAITAEIVSGRSASATARPSLYGYGYGVTVQPTGRMTLSHSGGFAMGAGTNIVFMPSAGIAIVVLSNAQPIGAVEALTASFIDLVQFGRVTRDWLQAYGPALAPTYAPVGSLRDETPPANAKPAAAAQSYIGEYTNDYFGSAQIVAHDGGLALKIGPKALEFPLRHWDGNVFVYTPSGENAPDGSLSTVTFTMDGTGKGSKLVIEFYAESGMGNFVRRPD